MKWKKVELWTTDGLKTSKYFVQFQEHYFWQSHSRPEVSKFNNRPGQFYQGQYTVYLRSRFNFLKLHFRVMISRFTHQIQIMNRLFHISLLIHLKDTCQYFIITMALECLNNNKTFKLSSFSFKKNIHYYSSILWFHFSYVKE